MFVVSRKNIIIPSPDGKTKYALAKGYMGTVPDWVAKTGYFKALVADGKIVVPKSKADAAVDKADKAAAETAKGKKAAHTDSVKAAETK